MDVVITGAVAGVAAALVNCACLYVLLRRPPKVVAELLHGADHDWHIREKRAGHVIQYCRDCGIERIRPEA